METECYKSLLAISRLGRDKAKIDQEIIDLVREIKVGYKNNNFNWDPTLRAKKKYIEDKITDIIYHLYSNDTPSEASRLNLEERNLFLENFQLTLNSMVRKKVNIKVQGQNEESFFKLNQEQLLNASAYRILPKDSRQRYLHSSKLMARLTVNVNKKNYNNLADALIKLYDSDPQKRVTQAKIMGPKKLGSRTDQAVIYLSEANIESAKEVSQQLKLLLPSDALIGHTPAGMKRLTTGISYSETVEGQSSSHGESRALIMAKAATESLLTGEKLKNTLPRTLQRFGYDPKDPALISQTIRDRFLLTGLNSPDQELSTIQPSRDIQQFVLNPEQFCYAYKINASYLNDIKEIPESGKVVFYRNEESEYEIKYVDETYRPDLSYALNSDFLDTSSKESDKGFSNYIDIKKTAPDNVFLFLSEVKKGSVIVTELNAEKYRVYYDARYNSSLLYDNVVMAVDEQDYKNEFSNNDFVFLYFDEDWKIVIQNRNNNEGVIFEPNNVKVKSAGDYSLDEKKAEFNLYRNNIHEKLNIFSKNLVRAMSVALAKDGQNGAGKLIDKLYVAAANPDDKNSIFLKEGLKNLHSNTDAVEASFSYGKMGLNKIQEILDVRDETMMFALNSNNHSMMLGKKIEKGKKTYYFYDPNFGVFAFDDNQSLFEAVRKFFIEKKFAPYYSAFEIDGKPAFNLVYIDTNKMGRVPIGSQLTVENLSENDDLTTIETRQNKARLILKNQDEIYQDLQLKRSLMILDANQWAEKIHEATFKLSVENELDGRWLPLFYNVEEVKEGHYRLQLIHLDDPSLTRWVETTDKTFKDFHQYSLDKMMEFGRYYHLIEEEFKLKPESAEGDSIDGLNAGIAIQSIIQWVEDRNRNVNTETSDTSNLAMALKIHTYLNYALIAHSTAKDVAHMAELVKTALRYQNKSVASSMTIFSSSLAKVANEGLSTFFNGALIGFDVYEITQAENEPQTITFGTQLAFDSASFLTSSVAIGADAFGYSTASASLGGIGVIVAGLGIGFTALARNFAIIGEDAKAVGLYFSALDNAYQGNGYEYSKDRTVLIPKFGAVFKTIDLQTNQIEFDSQYIYRTSEKSSGGGRKNYLFWAGNFPTMVHDRQQAINIRAGIGYANSNHTVDFSSQESLFLPITPKSYIKYDYNLWPGATTRHDNGFDVIRRLEQGDNFDYDFYIFPSENIITHIYHEYVNTPITIKLDNKKRNLIIPNLPKEWRGFIDYKLEGSGGQYTVNINEGVKILLSDSPVTQTPSQWFINSKEIGNGRIQIFDDRVRVGDVDIYIENKNPESKYYIIKNNNEVNEIELKTKSIKTVSVDEEVWKDNIKGFEEYLHTLFQEQKSHQQYVIIENYQHHGNNVGRAYFDVKTEKIIFTHSIETEKKDALLAGVRNDKAIFYSLESPLIWVTDLNNGNILFEYRLENKMARNLEILKVWPGENTIYFSCRYQDSFEVANYQIVENNIELVSIVSTPETLVYLASTHTQLEEVEPEEILKNYLIDNKNNIATPGLKGSNLASLVMISGNDHNQTQHRYWIRPQDNKLIKPNLSASLGFGHFPVDRTLKQSHWAIPEDLHLVTSLFDSDGTEVFYFYSDKQKSLYRQEGAGQDVLNVIKPSAWFMYTPNLESVFTWKGNLLLIDSFGVVSQLSANGNSSIVALNDKWFKDQAYWWRDLEYVYRDKPVIALLGIKGVDNGKILPAWSIQGKIIIAHQLSSENELQFLGMNATRSGGLIFDKKQKKLYEQYFATEKELIAAFAEGSTLNNPANLPTIIDLYPNYQFNKVERVADGLLMSAGSGEIFYIDLVNSQSINPNHLSSSLIIKGGKEHDILSPSIIKNVKNIILSGGEGQDSYLITQEAWLNYQTIIIDNDSYDEKEDLLILPPLNRQSLMTLRQNDDLVIFDMHSSTSLIIRQVFGEQSKTHNHLNIRMHNQSYSMSLSEFTSGTIQSEGLFNIQQGGVISQSEQQTQLIIEKITAFNFDTELSQQDSVAFFPPERVLSLMPPLLPAKKEK